MTDKSVEGNPFTGLFGDKTSAANSTETPIISNTMADVSTQPPGYIASAEDIIVNSLVENVFYITLNKNAVVETAKTRHSNSLSQLIYLEDLAASNHPKIEIDLDTLEQALFERLLLLEPSQCIIPKTSTSFIEHVIQKNVITYLFTAEQNLIPYENSRNDVEKKAVVKMRELILRNAVTALKQPDLFEGQNLSDQLYELFKDLDVLCHRFIADIIKEFASDDDPEFIDQLTNIFQPVLAKIYKDITSATLVTLDLYIFPALQLFATNQYLAYVLQKMCVPASNSGRAYQETILGALLNLSVLPKNHNAPYEYFDSPMDQSANSLTEDRLWTALEHLCDNLHKLFLALLKSTPNSKVCTLKFLAMCLYKNAPKGKMWNSQIAPVSPEVLMCVSDGFMLNLSSVLLRLCQPFCNMNDNKYLKIDPTYCAVDDSSREAKGVHMVGLQEETCIVPPREVYEDSPAPRPTAKTYSFITECFYMAHKSLDLGYRVAVDNLSRLSQDLNRTQRAYADALAGVLPINGNHVQTAIRQRIEKDLQKFVSMRCMLLQPQYVSLLANLHSVTCSWLVQVAIHEIPQDTTVVSDTYAPLNNIPLKFPITMETPDTLRCVPEFAVENVVGFISSLRRFSATSLEERGTMLLEPTLSFVLVFMGSAERMRNPHQRARMAECLEALLPHHSDDETPVSSIGSFYREKLFKEHPHRFQIVPSLLDVFVGIEVTGQSVQFEQKFNYRRPMYLIMDFLWEIEEHRNCFKKLSDEAEQNMEAVTPPIFLRFVNLLMNDAVFLLDEALSNMAQIRTMNAARDNNEWSSLPAQEREQNIANLHHIGTIARFDNILGRDTIRTLERLTGFCKSVFCHPTMVDRIASMLNYFLLHLVGPNQKNFKVKDSKEFEFDPGATVLVICKIYVHLSDSDGFLLAVSQDGRSYNPKLFQWASNVLSRIGGLDLIGPLQVVEEKVSRLAQQQLQDEEALVDAPDDFLDPIMNTLMMDPVILPSSRITVDRNTIARHLLSDQSDPFNRSPLSMDQVKQNEELKAKIHEWVKQKRELKSQESTSTSKET